jgi:uncharacterized membrane protein
MATGEDNDAANDDAASGDTPIDPPGDAGADHVARMQARLHRLERLIDPEMRVLRDVEDHVLVPAWRRVTQAEPRWPVSVVIAAAIAGQAALPDRVATQPRWLLPLIAGVLLAVILIASLRRVDHASKPLHTATIAVIVVLSLANAWSAVRLIAGLLNGTEGQAAGPLLITGGGIWLTNVVVFSLWYWQRDRGGPIARVNGTDPYPDFVFTQMQNPELAPPHWEPRYVDYLYLSLTNATAFSPTDVLPLSQEAKLTMAAQSLISLATVALVIARAVNILQ